MHRFSVLFLLPMAICVMEERNNDGVEYYGTSKVRYQKKTLAQTDTFPMSPSTITGSASKAFVELTTEPARPDNEISSIPVRTNISVISTQANIQTSPGPLYIGRKRPFVLPRRFPSMLKPTTQIPQQPLIFTLRPTILTDPQSSVILESQPSNISDSQSSIVYASNQSIPLISEFEVNTTIIKEHTVERSMAPASNTSISAGDIAVMFQLQEFQSKQLKKEPDYNVIVNQESTSKIQTETTSQSQKYPTINPLELKSQMTFGPTFVWVKEANTTIPLSLDKPKNKTEAAIEPLIGAAAQLSTLSFIDGVTQSPSKTNPQIENVQSLHTAVVTTSNQVLVSAVDTEEVSEPDVIKQQIKNPQLYLSNDFQSSKTETHVTSAEAFHQSTVPSVVELPETQFQEVFLFSPKVSEISKIPTRPTTESNFYELEREISPKSKSTFQSEPEFINQLQSELTYQQKSKLNSEPKPELLLQQGLEPVLQPKEELSRQQINESSNYTFPKLELVSHREIEFTSQSELDLLHQQGKELIAPPEQGLGSPQKHILNSDPESGPNSQQDTKPNPQEKSAPALLIKPNFPTGNQSSHTQNPLPQPIFVSVPDIVTEKRDNNGIKYYGTSNVRYQKIYPRPILISPITINGPPTITSVIPTKPLARPGYEDSELSTAANVSIVSSQIKIPTSPGLSYMGYRHHSLSPTFAGQTTLPLIAEPQSITISESQPSIVPKFQPLIESRMLTTMTGASIQRILDSQTHINTSFQASTIKSPIAPKTNTPTVAAVSTSDEYTNDVLAIPLPQVLQRSMQSQMEPGSLKTNPTLILNGEHNSKLRVEPTSQLQTEPTVQQEIRQNPLPQKGQIRKAEIESATSHLSASEYLQRITPQPIFSPIPDLESVKETDTILSYKSTTSEETANEATVTVSPQVSVASQLPEATTSQLASNPLTAGAEEKQVFSVPRVIIQLNSSPELSSRGDFQSSKTEIDSTPKPAIHNTTVSSAVQLSVISDPKSQGVLFSIPENSSKVSIPPKNEPIFDEFEHETREKIELGSQLEQKQNSWSRQKTTYHQGLHPISRSLLESMSRQEETLTLTKPNHQTEPNLEQISERELELGLITQELNAKLDTAPAPQSKPDLPSVEHFSDALNLDSQLTIKTDPKSDTQLGVVEETDITMQLGLQKSEHRQEPVLIPRSEIKLMSKQEAKSISQSQEKITSQREIQHTSLSQLELTIQKSSFQRDQKSTSRLASTSQHEPEMISPGPKTKLASRQEQMITSQLNLGLATQQNPQLTSQPEQDSAPQSGLNLTSEQYSLNFEPQLTVTTLSKIDVQQAAVKDTHITLPQGLHKSKHLQEAELESQLEQKLGHSKQESELISQQKEGLMSQLKQALTSHQNTNLTSEGKPESWSILKTELTAQRESELTSQQETALISQSTASLLKASSPRPVVAVPEIDLKPNGTYQMTEGQDINGMQYDGISNIRYQITQPWPLSPTINVSPTSITPASFNSVVAGTPSLKPDHEHSPGNPVSANISVVSSQHYRPSSSEPSYIRRRKPFVLPNRFRLKSTGQTPPRPLVLSLEPTSLTETQSAVVLEPLQSNVSISQSLTSSILQGGMQQISSLKTLVNTTLRSSNVEWPISATNTPIFSADRSHQLLSINVSLPLRPEKDSDSLEAKPEIILDPKPNFPTHTELSFQPLHATSKAPTLAVRLSSAANFTQIPITTNIQTQKAAPSQSVEVTVSNPPLVNAIETQVVSVSHIIKQPNTIPQLPLNGGSLSSVGEKHIENIATIHEPTTQSSVPPLASDKHSGKIVIFIQDFSNTSNSSIQHTKESSLHELENEMSENPNILGQSEQKLTSQLKAESINQGELELISRTAVEMSHQQGSKLLSQLTPELPSRQEEGSTSQLNVELSRTSQRDPKLTSQPLTSKSELELTSQQELEITSKPKAKSVSQSILGLPEFKQFSNPLNFKPQLTITSVPKINLQPVAVVKDIDMPVPLGVHISEYQQEVKLTLTPQSEPKIISKEEPEVISQQEDILMYHRKPEQTSQPQLELTVPLAPQLISQLEQELTSQQNQNFTSQLKSKLTSFLEPELISQSEQELTFPLERKLHSQYEAAVALSSKPNALKPSTQPTLLAFPQMDLKPTEIYEATEKQDIKEMEYYRTSNAQYRKTYPRPLPQPTSISPTKINTSASLKSVVPTAPPARSDHDVDSEIPEAPYVSVVASGFNKPSSPGPKNIGHRRPFVLPKRLRLKPTGQTPQQPLITAVETTSFTRTQLPLIPEPQLLSGSTILNSFSFKDANISITPRLNVSKTNQESNFVSLVPVTPQIPRATIHLSSVDNATQLPITTDTQTPVVASFRSAEVTVSNQSLTKVMETQIAPHVILEPELTHHQNSNFTSQLKSLPELGLSLQFESELTPPQETELSSIRESEQVLQSIINLPSVEQFSDPLIVITGPNIDPEPLVIKGTNTTAAPDLQQSQTIEELETPVTEIHELSPLLSLHSRVEINSQPQEAVAGLESRARTNQPTVIDITQLPDISTAQLSTVVTTQSQIISIPHVEQQTAPSLDSDSQPTASPALQSPLTTVSRLAEIIQGPSKTAENVTSYSSNLDPELVPQQRSDLAPRPVTEMTPQREAEMSTKLSSSLVKLKPQVNHDTVPESVFKAVDIKTPLAPLPSPNFKPITKLVISRFTQPAPQHKFTAPTLRVTQTLPGTISTAAQAKPKSSKLAFACKEKNGYYAVDNECNTFIQCQDNKATKFTCPDGLHFKPGTKYYENPCVQPSEVKCVNGTSKQYTRLSRLCPKQYGLFSMNDGDCSKYIMCNIGAPTIMNCPPGLVFNPTTESCDWLANVPQCNNPKVFKDFACPSPPLDEFSIESDIIYKYKYGQDCKLYIACQRGYPRLLSCGAGLAYDETSQSCIRADYVQDCINSYTVQS